ncbi:phosphoribosylformylglycinamidine synthase subunit PurS [Ligilactobacillus cholophilus]|uniref:phosphoribosylformylglycinamidine synthase subunit PurS n=1 Tax=Ligilactobacillus cholophilus TaxID=3050131 RepID=UPI0025B0E769|nr:phosphoribosylformylglycinamidine synthase subunit PurS [Ligilactobacillus cholophilus]
MKIRLFVNIKSSVFDPQSKEITEAAQTLGFENVADIKAGKFFDIKLKDQKIDEEMIKKLAENLLVNFNLETYHYEILEDE